MTVKGLRELDILNAYRRHRFAWLFVVLLLALGAAPLMEAAFPGLPALEIMLALSLLAAIGSTEPRSLIRWLLVLGAAFLATRLIQVVTGSAALLSLSQVIWLIVAAVATVAALRHAFRPGEVTSERIFAALAAYLMIGIIFAVCYWLIDQAWPGSIGTSDPLSLRQSVYFSFVTFATLGYGDVVPNSELAQSLAVVEAVSGQLYLAVLVARLVSLYARPAN
jgi:Ion channel